MTSARRFVLLQSMAAVAILAALGAAPDDVFPPWTPGMLDIHQIATGRGNTALYIFPGGATMLVDAGDAGNVAYADPRPDGSRPPKATIGARASQVASDHGHVVVRVEPGGERYRVYVLDDRTESYRVLSVHGPYTAE